MQRPSFAPDPLVDVDETFVSIRRRCACRAGIPVRVSMSAIFAIRGEAETLDPKTPILSYRCSRARCKKVSVITAGDLHLST